MAAAKAKTVAPKPAAKPAASAKPVAPVKPPIAVPVKVAVPVSVAKPVAAKPVAAKPVVAKRRADPEVRARMIAEAAYYIAEQRGFIHGHHDKDWAAAEKQIDELLARGS